ncbi:MAG: DEDD exonuclease domain-containing protein [Ilumatobacteraceae bacterium]
MNSRADTSEELGFQLSLDDLGRPLIDTTFCVLDLETTGTNSQRDLICEIGAVKVKAGETVGTFHTLVNPGVALPPQITVITGLTDAVLAPAPRIEQVITSLRQFIGDAVFVAHNASFDLGFVKAAFERAGIDDFSPTVVDTLTLSRRLFRDEVRNFKLGTLAQRFGIENRPSHRALDDALATRDLLYLLIERAAGWGVTGLDDLVAVGKLTGHPQAKKLRLTESLPRSPGVYLMVDDHDVVTYVGKATNLRQRVRSYFGNDERRSVIPMLRHLSRIEHIATPDVFTAEVLERRLISSLAPRHNRVGRKKRRPIYVRLDTNELWPRLSIVYQTRSQGQYLGPLAGRHQAEQAIEALQTAYPIRRCTTHIGPRYIVEPDAALCSSAQLGVAPCPCSGSADPAAHASAVEGVALAMQGESEHVIDALSERMRSLAAQQRFEEAASVRDRLSSLLSATTTARLVDAVTSAGRARFTLAGIDHKIDQGLVDLDHLGVIHRFDTSEADTDAERLLVARMIQRAAAQSRTISNVESSGQWRFPLSEPTVERLGSSERDHSLSVNVDDTNLPAGE